MTELDMDCPYCNSHLRLIFRDLKIDLTQVQLVKVQQKRVKSVYAFPNGMAVVFDYDDHQMPRLQGRWDEMEETIRAAADKETEWFIL